MHELYSHQTRKYEQSTSPTRAKSLAAQAGVISGPQSTRLPGASTSVCNVKISSLLSCSVDFPRMTAVRVIGPISGPSVLAYAQHDPGSQIILISTHLQTELDLSTRINWQSYVKARLHEL